MRAFLGFGTEEKFRKIVIHEILPAIAKAYGTIDVCVDAPGSTSNEVAIGIHEHFLKVIETYAKEQLSYHLTPDCGTDEDTVVTMKAASARVSKPYCFGEYMRKITGNE